MEKAINKGLNLLIKEISRPSSKITIKGIAQRTVSLNSKANPRRVPTSTSWRKTNARVESIISETHQVTSIVGNKSPIVVENSEINIEPVVATTI